MINWLKKEVSGEDIFTIIFSIILILFIIIKSEAWIEKKRAEFCDECSNYIECKECADYFDSR